MGEFSPTADDTAVAQVLLRFSHYDRAAHAYLALRRDFPSEFQYVHGAEWQSVFGCAVVAAVLFRLSGSLSEDAWNRLREAIHREYGQQAGTHLTNAIASALLDGSDPDLDSRIGTQVVELLQVSENTSLSPIALSSVCNLCHRVGKEILAGADDCLSQCEFLQLGLLTTARAASRTRRRRSRGSSRSGHEVRDEVALLGLHLQIGPREEHTKRMSALRPFPGRPSPLNLRRPARCRLDKRRVATQDHRHEVQGRASQV